jgi:hypothetical protein
VLPVRYELNLYILIGLCILLLIEFICYVEKVDRLCGLVVRVPGYTTEMYCESREVRTEFIYIM